MVDKYGVNDDPYCYPGTDVLINLFGISSNDVLENVEAELTAIRLTQYHDTQRILNFSTLKSLHFHLFQDLYDWAGQIRTVDISKGNTRFCNISRIEKETEKCFLILTHNNYLLDSDKEVFIKVIADFFCEMNVVHPFREGNGRTLRLFCELVAKRAGFILSWKNVNSKQWLAANIAGYNGRLQPLINIFSDAISVID
ncbi:putative adenosine monophosphate-protein transferase Fic [Thalassomonas sp. M1454]|uniref:putative adenosine monophosphate-protein transferase Fic n=1 Tax=Thalassomonas sp. M1454 TaxID=2594477 RepID=UPI00117E8EA1|nr:putative adenosine monophosphate-protein transferase Fic [Thalassomonas sp. M1454]TRX57149.1 putative adenosine monophosphate-protein transferase Fic [Thalassomonas sp. M1454]